ncbi:MAG: type IV toxin-antitoxin system AbiEi family antitoxin domain-containing protein [Propionibacteriaceae bacterium]|nr:type IV toxin-antitoxin system AbiEi family antitoxin domain-containing protein [Propionibacteriaceae bacterium]
MTVVTKLERLREVALDQHGLVTTAQAAAEGVSNAELSMMVARDRLDRVAHGVYRVPQVPETEFEPYQLAVLWTGAPEACLSHETALAAWEISDVNPDRIHITVSATRRIRRARGEQYVVHYEDIPPSNTTWWQGIRMVDVPTAITQAITSGAPTYLVRQALERAGRTSLLLPIQFSQLSDDLEQRDART